MEASESRLYRFGVFVLDTGERVLLREGQPVPLPPKTYETLAVLVERRGHIVDKEELLHRVWPSTFVEEVSLAKNVSRLRKTLGQDEGHHYIETIPKRGYRFIAPVEDGSAAVAAPPPVAATAPPAAVAGKSTRLLAFLSLLVVIGLTTWLMLLRRDPEIPAPVPKIIPLTSYPGREDQVAFSPDGNQIAFAWDEHQDGKLEICVKLIGPETLLRLTRTPGNDSKPAWSPDGQSIAFLRTSPQGSAYYVIPALGGAERKLADVFPYMDFGVGNSPYFSPDGKSLAILDRASSTEPSAIFLLSLDQPRKRRLTSPPATSAGDYYPAFSPDGTMLAFVRSRSLSTSDLYVLTLPGGDPRRLTFDGLTILGVAWTPDSREIIFSSRMGGGISYLWRVPAAGGKPGRISAGGGTVLSPAMAIHSNRLAYSQSMDDMNIWRVTLDTAGNGKQAVPLISSTFWDADPDYSPDGKRIAFMSGRSGGFGIWVSGADGSSPRLLFDGGPYLTGTPRWSPDGRSIAFDSRSNDPGTEGNPDIYVMSVEGGQPRRLTTHPAEDVAPSWSRDGRWLYFGSTRTGRFEIWKVPVGGGPSVQVTRRGGFEAYEAADGRYLYYLKGRAVPGIWRVPVNGGEESLVTDQNQAGLWRSWRIAPQGIYYATSAGPRGPRLEAFDLATGKIHLVAPMLKEPGINIPGLAVSPDGRTLLYTQRDQSGSDIMMVDGFR